MINVSSYASENWPDFDSSQIPANTPLNTLDTTGRSERNTFYWNASQYAQVSSVGLADFRWNEFKKAHIYHWLASTVQGYTHFDSISLEQAPSPDGTTEGQLVWYDYTGKPSGVNYETGDQILPAVVARVMPDGSTSYQYNQLSTIGKATNVVEKWVSGGSTLYRTNSYGYAANGIDLLTATNALGIRVSSNYFNSYHQVLTNYNALNELTVYSYNTNQQFRSVTRPNGLVTTNIYFTSGTFTNWLDRTMDFSGSTYFRTNSFTYGTNGLVYSQTDERGLTITNYWDNLQRLTGRLYPDGTTTSNLYYRLDGQSYANSSGGTNLLDLTATRDRLTNWTYFAYDAMRRTIYETNALGTVTGYGYCQCGALESVTSALGKPEQLVTQHFHDNQGKRTSTIYPDGSGTTMGYDSLGRVTNVISGFASVTNYYNNQGLLVTVSNAFGQALSATYDILDRATNTVDPNGVTITNAYDNLNRPLSRTYPDTGQ